MLKLNPPGTLPAACASLFGMASLHIGQAWTALALASKRKQTIDFVTCFIVRTSRWTILRTFHCREKVVKHPVNDDTRDRDVKPDPKRRTRDSAVPCPIPL